MDAHAGNGERAQHLSVIGLRRPRDAHVVLMATAVAKTPYVALARVFVAEARMRGEIRRRFRFWMQRQVRGRSAADHLRDTDLARDQAPAADIADADRQIDAFIDDVDGAIRKLDIEAQL